MFEARKSLLALLIFNLPGIMINSWGNLEIYMRSYFYQKSGYTKENLKIVPIIFMMVMNFSMILVPIIINYYYNIYMYAALGFIASFFYLFLCKANMLYEFYLLIIFMTLSSRLLVSIGNYIAAELYPKNRSFAIGFVISGLSMSNVVWNFIMTDVINPENKPIMSNEIFEWEVASRVPLFMTYLSIFSFTCVIVGTLLIDRSVFSMNIDDDAIADSLAESMSSTAMRKSKKIKMDRDLKELILPLQKKSIISGTKSEMIKKYSNSNTYNNKIEENPGNINPENQKRNLDYGNNMFYSRQTEMRNTERDLTYHNKISKPSSKSFLYELNSPLSNISIKRDKSKKYEDYFKKQPEEIVEDVEDYNSISNRTELPEINEIVTENILFNNYVNKEVFKVLFTTSFIRNMFSIYIMNNFKDIALININDDHFISYSSSFAFLLSLGFQMFGGIIIDRFGILKSTSAIYILYLIVISMYAFFATSKVAFVCAIMAFRIAFGLNAILNNSSLYNIYEKSLATRLLKYYFMNNLCGVIAGNILDEILVINEFYGILWLAYVALIGFGLYYAAKHWIIFDN